MNGDSLAGPNRSAPQRIVPIENIRIREISRLVSPLQIKEQLPLSQTTQNIVLEGRETARRILRGEDTRLLVIVGPCSIHDRAAALEYAKRLTKLRTELQDHYEIVMRVYFEKPRTTVGWKGLINDPHLNDTCNLAHGLRIARQLLLEIIAMGLPAATEFLDPIIPQYIADLISWSAIGARTTESQTHRELASGLSMPVGFKNGTDGSVQTAIDAMKSSSTAHSFLGIDQDGFTSLVKTTGNPDSHLVLRGGRDGANYASHHVEAATYKLHEAGLPNGIMVDCSHANSDKDPLRQPFVWQDILAQRATGRTNLIGAMLESNLHFGNQPLRSDPTTLQYGVSITDACMGWEMTETLLRSGNAEYRTPK